MSKIDGMVKKTNDDKKPIMGLSSLAVQGNLYAGASRDPWWAFCLPQGSSIVNMSLRKKLLIIILAVFLGLPSVSLAGSFVVSLIEGKTPAEAVQIIAEQVDSLLGRVDTLEVKQSETSLEIERLKLENENLRLKNENLGSESIRVAQQVVENEKSVDAVNRCQVLEKPRVCAQNGVEYANKLASAVDLPATALLDDVLRVLDGGPWYSKTQTDEICLKFNGWQEDLSNGENCRSRVAHIQGFNQDQESRRQQSVFLLKQSTDILESSQAEFKALQCDVLLKKYVPNRSAPGCG